MEANTVELSAADRANLDVVREAFAKQVEAQEAAGHEPIFTARAMREMSESVMVPMALAVAANRMRSEGLA